MRELRVKNEAVREQLDLLVSRTTPRHQYQAAMRKLGAFSGAQIEKRAGSMRKGLVVCTPEDANFLAACDQRHVMIDPGTGEEMDAITRETFALSADVLAKTA